MKSMTFSVRFENIYQSELFKLKKKQSIKHKQNITMKFSNRINSNIQVNFV